MHLDTLLNTVSYCGYTFLGFDVAGLDCRQEQHESKRHHSTQQESRQHESKRPKRQRVSNPEKVFQSRLVSHPVEYSDEESDAESNS